MSTATLAPTTGQILDQFKVALLAYGLEAPKDLQADGQLHRCNTLEGRPNNKAGAYLLHLDGVPAGGYQNHQDGAGWQNWRADIGRELSATEQQENRRRMEAIKAQREEEQAKVRAMAAQMASEQLSKATACESHPYLHKKGVKPHGARVIGDSLLLKMRDTQGKVHSLQTIDPQGGKRFLTGGRKQGCFYFIGEMPLQGGVIAICEGFATGASVHEATGYAVAVAFDAGNLLPVGKALQQARPDMCIVICADDDADKASNTGKQKGYEAALELGVILALPDFGNDRPSGLSDFNDLHKVKGLGAVAACIEKAIKSELHTTGGGVSNSGYTPAATGGGEEGEEVSRIEQAVPTVAGSAKPKRHEYAGGAFEVSAHGVFFLGTDKDGNEQPPKWICSKLEILASTRDTTSKEWGRLLAWEDGDGVAHRWPLPMELLQGDGLEMRRELARLGLQISPTKAARDLLATYVQVWPAKARAVCVDKLGWHGAAYVTPSEAIGDDGEITVFQSTQAIEPAFSVSGTVASWGDSVAAMAAGNSRMVFAISTAFAAPLLELLGEESGGFHLRGGSSMGKTTALKVAASVWGNPKRYPRLWRATANGLEGLAALHNDGLLILDELSQADPSAAGEAAYMLANGQGKTRAAKTGAARAAASWRLLFLSSGEESLGGMMRRAGKVANAGQEIRLADIAADAGAGLGAFETIHAHQSAAAFALALNDAALQHHGEAGVEWLRRIVADRQNIASGAAAQVRDFAAKLCPPESAGQVQRVARRFALVALAGEMATAYGLTGWQAGEAQGAVQKCFDAWLEGFGGASPKEGRAIIEQVRGFIELHGASRFEDLGSSNQPRIINRAGFIRTDNEGRNEYLVLPTVFQNELCKGFDLKAACKALHEAGALLTKEQTRYTQKPRITGHGQPRVYVLSSRIMEGD